MSQNPIKRLMSSAQKVSESSTKSIKVWHYLLPLTLLGFLAAVITQARSPQWLSSSPTETATDTLVTDSIRATPSNAYTVIRSYTGEVLASRTSDLGFEYSGTLVHLFVDEGDHVASGTPLARLDTQDREAQRQQLLAQKEAANIELEKLRSGPRSERIGAAQANVAALQNQVKLARLRESRREELAAAGAISQEQLDSESFGADVLTNQLAAAQNQLDELLAGTRPEDIAAKIASIKQLDAKLLELDVGIRKHTLTAPFSGRIATRLVDEGTIVSPSQAVFRLAEDSNAEVLIGLPITVGETLLEGSHHTITIGDQAHPAKLKALLPELDPTTRTISAVFQLEHSQFILTGEIAHFTAETSTLASGYWIPTTALIPTNKGLWSIYALVPKSNDRYEIERRNVSVLHSEAERSYVRGSLSPNDLLIPHGVNQFVPGQEVQLRSER